MKTLPLENAKRRNIIHFPPSNFSPQVPPSAENHNIRDYVKQNLHPNNHRFKPRRRKRHDGTTVCANTYCQAAVTPQWRKGWYYRRGDQVDLCNACGIHYQKDHYCFYCKDIYRKITDIQSHKDTWLRCTKCGKAVHAQCLQIYQKENKHDKNSPKLKTKNRNRENTTKNKNYYNNTNNNNNNNNYNSKAYSKTYNEHNEMTQLQSNECPWCQSNEEVFGPSPPKPSAALFSSSLSNLNDSNSSKPENNLRLDNFQKPEQQTKSRVSSTFKNEFRTSFPNNLKPTKKARNQERWSSFLHEFSIPNSVHKNSSNRVNMNSSSFPQNSNAQERIISETEENDQPSRVKLPSFSSIIENACSNNTSPQQTSNPANNKGENIFSECSHSLKVDNPSSSKIQPTQKSLTHHSPSNNNNNNNHTYDANYDGSISQKRHVAPELHHVNQNQYRVSKTPFEQQSTHLPDCHTQEKFQLPPQEQHPPIQQYQHLSTPSTPEQTIYHKHFDNNTSFDYPPEPLHFHQDHHHPHHHYRIHHNHPHFSASNLNSHPNYHVEPNVSSHCSSSLQPFVSEDLQVSRDHPGLAYHCMDIQPEQYRSLPPPPYPTEHYENTPPHYHHPYFVHHSDIIPQRNESHIPVSTSFSCHTSAPNPHPYHHPAQFYYHPRPSSFPPVENRVADSEHHEHHIPYWQ